MHDIKAIRDNPQAFDDGLARRGLEPRAESLIGLDDRRRAAILELQRVQERRNAASKEIGQAMARKERRQARRSAGEQVGRAEVSPMPALEFLREQWLARRWRPNLPPFPICRAPTFPSARTRTATAELRRHWRAAEVSRQASCRASISKSAKRSA